MNQQQALEIINAARNSGKMSNYADNEYEMYTGYNDPALEFNGGSAASLISAGSDAEPFELTIVNSDTANHSFLLGAGLLRDIYWQTFINSAFASGATFASCVTAALASQRGIIRTGLFAAYDDTSTNQSLTGSTTNTITIEQFFGYCLANPTYSPFINATSTSATIQYNMVINWWKNGMTKNTAPTTIPFRKYASQDAYQQQYFNITENIYLCDNYVYQVYIAASSTLILQIYPLASHSKSKQIVSKVNQAKQALMSNPNKVKAVDSAIKTAHMALPCAG